MESNKHFSTISREQLDEYRRQGHEKRRSPQLKEAQADRQIIRELYEEGVNVKLIAKKYGIHRRQIYRLINED